MDAPAAMDTPGVPDPVSIEQVLATIQGALSNDPSVQSSCETLIRKWESDAAPGFLGSLIKILQQPQAIDEATRMLAVVIAKNAVGSSWRKTLGTREWSRVPEEEKVFVRDSVAALLFSEPSDKVALQVSLLITNIARFDFPSTWEQLLSSLLQAAAWNSTLPVSQKLRALKTLRHVLNGLITKRFVIDTRPTTVATVEGRPGALGTAAAADFKAQSQRINSEREVMRSRVQEVHEPLQALIQQHLSAFLSCAPGWELHGAFAKAALKAQTELLSLSQASEGLHPGTRPLLEQLHTACTVIASGNPQGALDPAQLPQWQELGGRLYERTLRCIIAYLDVHPIPFAEYVPYFLSLLVENALIAMDAAALHAMRAKRRVLLARFIAKALLCPYYRTEWLSAPNGPQAVLTPAQGPDENGGGPASESKKRAGMAHTALEQMLASWADGGKCELLVEAVIAKYVALSQEELDEWQHEPEEYLRSMDVECSPDADTPRPIGVGLLLCMLERGGESVAKALIQLAAHLQTQTTPESILLREATYRAIGEGYQHVCTHVSFQSWFENELSKVLAAGPTTAPSDPQALMRNVLVTRALWLVGVCGGDLPDNEWGSAYGLVVQHTSSSDPVVALTAVSSQMALTANILDDVSMLDQIDSANRKSKPTGVSASSEVTQLQETLMKVQEAPLAEIRARVEQRTGVVSDTAPPSLNAAFSLLSGLTEVESMVRVLQLVSVLVECMGPRVQPHLGIIAAALPQVWSLANSATHAETGALVRLHSALIAVLTHLVGKLRAIAVSDPQLQSVIYPLLQFATKVNSSESEVLVEEALKLWNATICSLPQVPQPLLELLPHLARLLQRGKDNTILFPILESYMMLGGTAALEPYSALIASGLTATITNIANALNNWSKSPTTSAISGEVAAESTAASALADVMLQLFPANAPAMLMPLWQPMVEVLANPQIPMAGLHVKILNIMEGFLEVLGRLLIFSPPLFHSLLGSDPEKQSRFMERWLTVSSARFLEELLGVKSMAMLGRFRRRIATVALCALVNADVALPVLTQPSHVERLCVLVCQAAMEDEEFKDDQQDMDNMDFKSDLGEDHVLAKRLELARNDVVRSFQLVPGVHNMLLKLAAVMGGQPALLAACGTNPRLNMQVGMFLQHGKLQPEEDSADEMTAEELAAQQMS